MSQPIYSATQTTLTGNLDIPIQQGKGAPSIWVNIANNSIQGQTSGTTVTIYPNGSPPGIPVGYGASQSINVGNPGWIRISGTGANITVIIGHEEIALRSVSVLSVDIPATVKTDVGQGTQAGGNTTLNFGGTPIDPRDIRNLGPSDKPVPIGSAGVPLQTDANGNLGLGLPTGAIDPRNIRQLLPTDQPVIQGETPTSGTYKPVQTDANGNLLRGWNLGASDVPGRGWLLGSSDIPNRSWSLGNADTPVVQGETPTAGTYKPIQTDANGNLLRGWTLGASDVPNRGWSLGNIDQPDITVNQSKALGTSTLPVYIRPLASTDNPDITVNQANPLGNSTKPVYIRTLGSSDQPDITANQSKALGSSTAPVYIRPLASTDNPDITVNQANPLGSSSKPVYIRPLNSSDAPGRSWGLGFNDNPDITVNQANPLGSSTKPVYIRTLNSSDNPKPIGSNGGAFTQDTANNLQHVPVLQGSLTPIHTKALQYDSNGYPLHTRGSVLANGNGGDTVLPSNTALKQITAPFSGNLTSPAVPAGYKWVLSIVGLILSSSSNMTTTQVNLQLYFPGTPALNSWFQVAFNDVTTRTIGSGGGAGIWWWLPNMPEAFPPPSINMPGIAWNLPYYSANLGPASGETTYITKPFILYAGSQITFYVDITAVGGTVYAWLALLGEQVPL